MIFDGFCNDSNLFPARATFLRREKQPLQLPRKFWYDFLSRFHVPRARLFRCLSLPRRLSFVPFHIYNSFLVVCVLPVVELKPRKLETTSCRRISGLHIWWSAAVFHLCILHQYVTGIQTKCSQHPFSHSIRSGHLAYWAQLLHLALVVVAWFQLYISDLPGCSFIVRK